MSRKVTNGLDLQTQRIINVGDGSAATDAVNRQQLDAAIRGLDWKHEVIAGSTGNVSLTAPGTTLDGITLTAGMQTIPMIGTVTRILLKDQTAAAENGIYDWNGSAAVLTRSVDSTTGVQISGSTTTVQRGTVNADRVYRVLTDDVITLGTTSISWGQVGGGSAPYTAGNGLSLTGQAFAVVAGSGIIADGASTRVDPAVVVRKFALNNTATTTTTANHNLGTRDVTVTVFDTTTFEEVLADVVHTDTNNVAVTFAVAPAAGAYRIVVQG